MSQEEQKLLKILEELDAADLKKFTFHLQNLEGESRVPRGRLENKTPIDLPSILVGYYGSRALEVTKQVLGRIPRRDLVERLYSMGGCNRDPKEKTCIEEENQTPVKRKAETEEGGADASPMENHSRVKKSAEPLVTDQQLMKLAKNMDRDWKQIGIQFLKLSKTDLDQCEENNRNNLKLQVFDMLKIWAKREKEKATPANLHRILSQEEVPIQSDYIDFLIQDDQ
ncbi:uncharacterized protein ZGC:174906 [Latimeria chalumnae]|uniref:Death domain-containing protein n=1 Tax=Latimeria chalumnae TaxID=7897 RepID=M3XIN3_LATCH|nr:PREDICTED: uncharacterized protein LOC102346064 [Latimeria chalumnae]|eukprot:XP_005986192.1 PREDICTED: uncharacterized protein LOC102346064 [Latimeria chalumnae]